MKYKDEDIQEWPQSWAGVPEDRSYGEHIIRLMKPFIEELKGKLGRNTVNEHIDNLWMLGGYSITQLNYYPEKRKDAPEKLLLKYIDSGDGPLINEFSDYQQERFDATCRKLYKFLMKKEKLY